MIIRRAGVLDISAIIALLIEMHNGTDVPASKIHSEKMVNKITETIHRGIGFVSLNDNNVIEGSIGGLVASDWWSDEKYLGDLWFYVTPEARKSNAAFELVRNFKKVGKVFWWKTPQRDRPLQVAQPLNDRGSRALKLVTRTRRRGAVSYTHLTLPTISSV